MSLNRRYVFIAIAATTVLTSAILAQEVAAPKAPAEVREKASGIEPDKGAKKKRANRVLNARLLLAVRHRYQFGRHRCALR
jgi:hypothetical protein